MAPGRWALLALALLPMAQAQGLLATDLVVTANFAADRLAIPVQVVYAYPASNAAGTTTVGVEGRAADGSQLRVHVSPPTFLVDPRTSGGSEILEATAYLEWTPGAVGPQLLVLEARATENAPLQASSEWRQYEAWPPVLREPREGHVSTGAPATTDLAPLLAVLAGVLVVALGLWRLRR